MLVLFAILLWLAGLSPAGADPLSIGVAVLVNLGYAGTLTGTLATLVGSAVLAAGAIGVSLLASTLTGSGQQRRSDGPTPTDRQATIRQTTGPRLRFYGRVKVGGTLWFFESRSGFLYTGVTLNWGEISAIIETWLNDTQVTLDGDGFVLEAPFNPVIRVINVYGIPGQTALGTMVAAFPDGFTTDHRLLGTAYLMGIFNEVPAAEIPNVYPQGNQNIREVIDASLLTRVRDGSYGWSDNPADVINDYLTGRDEAGFPFGAGYSTDLIDLPSFRHFADLSDQAVPLKAGGTIKRYRLWGGYALNEQQRDVLPRFLKACDGDLFINGAGKIAIRGGEWIEPTLTLDADLGHIISAEFRQGNSALAAFNELTITYTEPDLDYQEVEAEPWRDVANIALRGEVLTDKLDVLDAPVHAQARRLGKIYTAKNNPRWIGTLVTNFYGLNALDEVTARIKFPLLGIDETFLLGRVKINDDLSGCTIEVRSLGPSAYAWDAELEEGTAPGQPVDTAEAIDLPAPDDVVVSAEVRDIGGGTNGVFLRVTWTEPDRTALLQQVQYRESPAGPWLDMTVADGEGLAESGIVNDGGTYDVRIRTLSPGGTTGDWFTIEDFVATP